MEDDQQFCLRWNNHQTTLIQNFDTLLESGTLVDCTLAAEGKYLKAHKVVLSACSPYFEGLLSEHYDKHPVFILKDVKFKELKAMMDYMYRGEVNISQDQLAALLKAAESLQIKGLSESRTGGNGCPKPDTRQSKVSSQSTAPSLDIPHASSGLTIEKNSKVPRQSLAQSSVGDLPEDSASPSIPKGISSREGSQSPVSRKRKRLRRRSVGEDNSIENHESNSSDMTQQAIPALGVAPVADEKSHADPADSLGRSALMQQLTKPADEMLQLPVEKPEPTEDMIQPKSEYLDDPEESVEDLTLDDDMNDLNEMEDSNRAGPSSHDPNQHPGLAAWHVTGDRSNAGGVGSVAGGPGTQDEVFLAAHEAVQAQRDSQELTYWDQCSMRDPLLITDLDKKCKVYKYTDLQNRGKEEMTTNLSNLEVILTEENFNSSSYGKKKHFKTPLESLLTSSPEGKVILSVWKTEKKFTDVHRQKLGDEIIREELRSNINKKLTDERIDFWTQSILDLFPGEIKEVWNGTSEKCRNQSAGRGMLLQRYYSMRRKLLKSGVISKSTEKSASLNPTEVTESRETKDAIEYLKNTTRSVSQIIDIWQTTSNVRFTYLKKNEITAQDYMDQFKALKLIDGHKLLEADFENIYPDSTSNLFNEWPFLCRFVMSKVTSVERESVDKCITTDGKKAKIIRLMHSLFNVKTIFCKNKKHWRPSRTEARDGLLQYVKAEDDAVKIINEKRKNFTDLGISHGPQVLAISNNQDTIECSYVIINQVWYPIENPLKALDVAFKAAHMLNIPYPMECQREMLFLQLAIYGIKVDNIKKIDVKTTSLIAEYRNFKSDNND